MNILALQSATRHPAAAMLQDGRVLGTWQADRFEGLAAALPLALADLIARHGAPSLIAVCVGPGSFTGLRAGIATAMGLARGYEVPLIAVTQADAFRAAVADHGTRTLWCAIDSQRGRIFLDQGAGFFSTAIDDIVVPRGVKLAVAGDAAIALAAFLAARDTDVALTNGRHPQPRHIAAAALLRHQGHLPALAVEPLYIDAPAVTQAKAAPPV